MDNVNLTQPEMKVVLQVPRALFDGVEDHIGIAGVEPAIQVLWYSNQVKILNPPNLQSRLLACFLKLWVVHHTFWRGKTQHRFNRSGLLSEGSALCNSPEPRLKRFIDSIICSFHLSKCLNILVDLEPLLGTTGTRQEYTSDGIPIQRRAP